MNYEHAFSGPFVEQEATVPHGLVVVQNILAPELSPVTEQELFFRTCGGVAFSASQGKFFIQPGSRLDLGTYFNAFSLRKWHESGALAGLWLQLRGVGKVQIRVCILAPKKLHVAYCEVLDLDGNTVVDLSHYVEFDINGIMTVDVTGVQSAVLQGGGFLTRKTPVQWPRLALSITTFKREDAVRATVKRLTDFIEKSAYGSNLHILVVDNGKSAGVEPARSVTPVDNPNLGGAGGFARGLKEAEDRGFTHCLFMDDDAACLNESIHRTYMFLALTDDPKTAVAGAMISTAQPWVMWENGALFDGSCHPQSTGTDLSHIRGVHMIEDKSAQACFRNDPRLYGGWWYFAFPIASVTHYPFPFFVRGDDISFSLANDFNIMTLNGVVSFQDDFGAKESPQTLYLDLRNHLVHHLVFPALERSALGTAKIALRFILRSCARFQYETARAQLLAWEDVMKGPDFFNEHADMSRRRADIAAMTRTEKWRSVEPADLKRRVRWSGHSPRWQKLFAWLLNGHLVPFWNLIGDDVVIEIEQRGLLYPAWGARQITYLDGSHNRCYVTRQSKWSFLQLMLRSARIFWRFLWDYRRLKTSYTLGYAELTTKESWMARFTSNI